MRGKWWNDGVRKGEKGEGEREKKARGKGVRERR